MTHRQWWLLGKVALWLLAYVGVVGLFIALGLGIAALVLSAHTVFAGLVIVWMLLFGWLGRYIACQKGRKPGEGLLMGALLGMFGCLIEALLPSQ